MTEQEQEPKKQPLYYPLLPPQKEAEWQEQQNLRLERLMATVKPTLDRQVSRLSPEGRKLIASTLSALTEQIVGPRAINANAPDIFLDFNYPDKGPRSFFVDYLSEADEHEKGVEIDHNQETLKAADFVIKALTPEMNISLFDEEEKIMTKAMALRSQRLALIWEEEGWVVFATIIPHIVVRFVFGENGNNIEVGTSDSENPDRLMDEVRTQSQRVIEIVQRLLQ